MAQIRVSDPITHVTLNTKNGVIVIQHPQLYPNTSTKEHRQETMEKQFKLH